MVRSASASASASAKALLSHGAKPFVIRDIVPVSRTIQERLGYRLADASVEVGEPVFTFDGDVLETNKLRGGWVVKEVVFRWVEDVHMRYCHKVTLEHEYHGRLLLSTAYRQGNNVVAERARAWRHFVLANGRFMNAFDKWDM
jgi:hypothetical protein